MLSLRGSSYNMFLLLFSLAATSPFIVDVYSEVHAETKLRLAYPDVLHTTTCIIAIMSGAYLSKELYQLCE